jgi:myosin-5
MLVLSGESGSGKTELAKYAIDFFVSVSPQSGSFQTKIQMVRVEFILLFLFIHSFIHQTNIVSFVKSNQILEAFGHAPTIYNSNSTRFCKYFELRYTPEGILNGGKVTKVIYKFSF